MNRAEIIVPRDPRDNMVYRQDIRKWAMQCKSNRQWLMDRCNDDFFFWLETFSWIFEPRPEPGKHPIRPFIPWAHQRPFMKEILKNFGYNDIGLQKARGEGATWSCLMIILYHWIYRELNTFGLVSRNEMAADNPQDTDSLGWKLDWELKQLPVWMAGVRGVDYDRNVSKHTWFNRRNGSSITAYPATGELASGGRKTAFFLDELGKFPRPDDERAIAAVEPVTECLLIVSTYNGTDGAYYRVMKEKSTMVKLTLDWKENPIRNQNLFRVDYGNSQLLDHRKDIPIRFTTGLHGVNGDVDYTTQFFKDFCPILQRRSFDVHDKKRIWSPWYVSRCLRPGMTPRTIAEEYDMDPGGTGNRFFPVGLINTLIENAKIPVFEGDIDYDSEELKINRILYSKGGPLKLWLNIGGRSAVRQKPPPGDYVCGVDVASGQGGDLSSNSVLSFVNRKTGVKVGEFSSPNITPERLAVIAIALCKWFANSSGGSAYLIWEGNGYGGAFRDRVLLSTFRNFHWRVSHKKVGQKKTKEPGWYSNKDSKRDLLSRYRMGLTDGHFDNPSKVALQECLQYEYGPSDKVIFISSLADADDPSNAGENHGDRVIADALANLGCIELNGGIEVVTPDEPKFSIHNPPEGSFAWRRKQYNDKLKRAKEW